MHEYQEVIGIVFIPAFSDFHGCGFSVKRYYVTEHVSFCQLLHNMVGMSCDQQFMLPP